MKTEIAVVKNYDPGMDLGIAKVRGTTVNFSITAHCALVAGNGTPTFGEFDGNAKPEKGVHIIFIMKPGGDFVEKWARFVDWKSFTRKPAHLDKPRRQDSIGLNLSPAATLECPLYITSAYSRKRWRKHQEALAAA